MTAQSMGIVMVRLFSIYLVVTAIQSLSYTLPALFNFGTGGMSSLSAFAILGSVSLWLGLSTVVIPALCAWWLWRNAERVLPGLTDEEPSTVDASDFMLVGVSLLGLYLLTWGIINIARVEASIAMRAEAGMGAISNAAGDTAMSQRLPSIIQVLVAIPMLLGRHRLAELLVRAKFAGTKPGPRAES